MKKGERGVRISKGWAYDRDKKGSGWVPEGGRRLGENWSRKQARRPVR